ncbi:MAG: T9SS type A sorting domain-containing protein [Bacteroidota bacterium]
MNHNYSILLLGLFFSLFPFGLRAQVVQIPDSAFKMQLLALGVDQNRNGKIEVSEAEFRKNIQLQGIPWVKDMTGLEAFVNLENLELRGHPVEHLPLTKLSKLRFLQAPGARFDTLDLSGNTLLRELNINGSVVPELNLQQLPNLERAFISFTGLTKLNLEALPSLRVLTINWTEIDSLDLGGVPNLRHLELEHSLVRHLDARSNIKLEHLNCASSRLKTLKLPNGYRLRSLNCGNNNLVELDARDLIFLEFLDCDFNKLKRLNLSRNFGLKELSCHWNQLKEIDLKNCPQLQFLKASFNELDSMNLSGSQDLMIVDVEFNLLSSLILPENNQIRILKTGRNPNIRYLRIPQSRYLTELDIHDCPELEEVCFEDLGLTLGGINIFDYASPKVTYVSCREEENDIPVQGPPLYPNPAQDRLTVRAQWDAKSNQAVGKPSRIIFYTLSGQEVWRKKISQPGDLLVEVDVSSLPAGLYLVQIQYSSLEDLYDPIWTRLQIVSP